MIVSVIYVLFKIMYISSIQSFPDQGNHGHSPDTYGKEERKYLPLLSGLNIEHSILGELFSPKEKNLQAYSMEFPGQPMPPVRRNN